MLSEFAVDWATRHLHRLPCKQTSNICTQVRSLDQARLMRPVRGQRCANDQIGPRVKGQGMPDMSRRGGRIATRTCGFGRPSPTATRGHR